MGEDLLLVILAIRAYHTRFFNIFFFTTKNQRLMPFAMAHHKNSKYSSITAVTESSPIPSPRRLIYCNFVCMYVGKQKPRRPVCAGDVLFF